MTEVGKGVIPITFDKDQIGRDLTSNVDSAAHESEGHISSTFKKLAGLATAAFAGVQVVGFVKDSIDAARESNKVGAQTEAVIKSTGGAAGVSAKQFSDLANSIAMKTGIDDEQIQSSENLLATFTNVRNEVGDGNDIFNQATVAITDMSVALGQDTSASAIQLGKALNDPIAGVTALRRVGVQLSDEQKDQIKTLIDHGDKLGAQKIILGELTKEFGGSAEATATAGAKWGVFWDNLQENFGNLLIPALDATAQWAMTTLPNAFGALQDAVGPVIDQVVTDVSEFWTVLTTGFTQNEGGSWWENFAFVLRDDVWPIVQTVSAFMADHWQPILIGLAIAVGALTAPFTTIAVGLTTLYVRSEKFRDIVDDVIVGLQVFGSDVVRVFHTLQDALGPAFREIGSDLADLARFFADRWDHIRGTLVTTFKIIEIAVAAFIAPFVIAWKYFHEQILAVVQVVWNEVGNQLSGFFRVMGDLFDFFTALMSGDWGAAWDAIRDIPAAVFDTLKGTIGNLGSFVIDFFSSLPGNIISALGDLASLLGPKAVDLLHGLLDGLVTAWVDVAQFFYFLPGNILALMAEAGTWLVQKGLDVLKGLWTGITTGAADVWNWFTGLPGTIAGYFVGAIGWLQANGGDIIRGLIAGVGAFAIHLWVWFISLPGTLLDACKDAANWLVQVGKDLVAGIVKGIASTGNVIADALKSKLPGGGGIPSLGDLGNFVTNPAGVLPSPVHFASGGDPMPGSFFTGAEQGFEILLKKGLYQAPPYASTVIPHDKSAAYLAGLANGGQGQGGPQFVYNGPVSFGSDRDTVERDQRWLMMTTVGI